jgi:hypothetical protein
MWIYHFARFPRTYKNILNINYVHLLCVPYTWYAVACCIVTVRARNRIECTAIASFGSVIFRPNVFEWHSPCTQHIPTCTLHISPLTRSLTARCPAKPVSPIRFETFRERTYYYKRGRKDFSKIAFSRVGNSFGLSVGCVIIFTLFGYLGNILFLSIHWSLTGWYKSILHIFSISQRFIRPEIFIFIFSLNYSSCS